MKGLGQYGGVAGIVLLGLALRFWNLDLKPLWMDETITLLFALGRRYESIPRDVVQPLPQILAGLTWQPQSCGVIAQAIQTQSTHPPLFFCLMHQWMGWLHESGLSLRWQVRSLPALLGTLVIAAIYGVNRIAISHRAGVWAAALMAVSPYGIYLSQEGRHYTLPLLLITLSLIPMLQLVQSRHSTLLPWLAWIGLNSLGFYVHYFCLLAFVAQATTLVLLFRRQGWSLSPVLVACGGVVLSFLPWLPILLHHSQRPETDWLQFKASLGWHWLEPPLRLLAGCIITVILLPVEDQPLGVVIGNGLLMVGVVGWIAWMGWQGRSPLALAQTSQARLSLRSLGYFLGIVGLEYLGLAYGLHKDLTLAFRYNFIFYPALCALLGIGVTHLVPNGTKGRFHGVQALPWVLVGCSVLSAGFVVTDQTFLKPFSPQKVAQQFSQTSDSSLVVVKDYNGWQDIALGLSEALALESQRLHHSGTVSTDWGFLKPSDAPRLQLPVERFPQFPLTLWHVSPLGTGKSMLLQNKVLPVEFRQGAQAQGGNCVFQQPPQNRMGVAYQSFQCRPGGTIAVETETGEFTEFSLTLPMALPTLGVDTPAHSSNPGNWEPDQ